MNPLHDKNEYAIEKIVIDFLYQAVKDCPKKEDK